MDSAISKENQIGISPNFKISTKKRKVPIILLFVTFNSKKALILRKDLVIRRLRTLENLQVFVKVSRTRVPLTIIELKASLKAQTKGQVLKPGTKRKAN